jgi:hypothetical protein
MFFIYIDFRSHGWPKKVRGDPLYWSLHHALSPSIAPREMLIEEQMPKQAKMIKKMPILFYF